MRPLIAAQCSVPSTISLQVASRQPADVALRHVAIVDVQQARLIPNQAVVTRGDTIVAVGDDKACGGVSPFLT